MKKILLLICASVGVFANVWGQIPEQQLTEVNIIGEPGFIPQAEIAGAETFPSGYLNCVPNSCLVVLPVKLLSFDGRRLHEKTVELKWQTIHEVNNRHFEVERSLGNTTQFINVATVRASPDINPVHNYRLNDPNNYSGTSYYRLRQVDVDGKYTYSKIISVKGFSRSSNLRAFPNPARSVVNVAMNFEEPGPGALSIYDLNGKLVFQKQTKFLKGENVIAVPVGHLSPGLYMVKLLKDEQMVGAVKVLKHE